MHRLRSAGIVIVTLLALGGVSAGIVAAQSSDDPTPTPAEAVATAEDTADATATPSEDGTDDGSKDADGSDATEESDGSDAEEESDGEGRLCPEKEGETDASETTTSTTL